MMLSEYLISDLNKEFGVLNGLVNNAAGNFLSTSEDLSAECFQNGCRYRFAWQF